MRISPIALALAAVGLFLAAAPAAAQSPAGDPCAAPATTGLSFDLYEGRLTPESEATVDRLAAALRACPEAHFEVQVHTDTVRLSSFNRRASQRIAEVVRDRLAQRGVPAAQLAPCGYGESQPLRDVEPSWRGNRNERLVLKRIGDAATHRCPA